MKIKPKEVEVDTLIAPLVIWLNKFEHVYTLYSCQGDECNNLLLVQDQINKDATPGYVSFICRCKKTLAYLMETLYMLGIFEISNEDNVTVYTFTTNIAHRPGILKTIIRRPTF